MPHFLPPRESRFLLAAAPGGMVLEAVPEWAAAERAQTAGSAGAVICVTNLPSANGTQLHWLEGSHARGWVQTSPMRQTAIEPNVLTAHTREALDQGFVGADAVLLAFLRLTGELPRLSWDSAPVFAPARAQATQHLDLYAITDDVARLEKALAAGVRTVQLRIKRPAEPDAAWCTTLRETLAKGINASRRVGAQCFVNDHWTQAAELGADAVHLGQEDLMALGMRAASACSLVGWPWASAPTACGSYAARGRCLHATSPAARYGRPPPRTCPGCRRTWTTWPGGASMPAHRWWPSAGSWALTGPSGRRPAEQTAFAWCGR